MISYVDSHRMSYARSRARRFVPGTNRFVLRTNRFVLEPAVTVVMGVDLIFFLSFLDHYPFITVTITGGYLSVKGSLPPDLSMFGSLSQDWIITPPGSQSRSGSIPRTPHRGRTTTTAVGGQQTQGTTAATATTTAAAAAARRRRVTATD